MLVLVFLVLMVLVLVVLVCVVVVELQLGLNVHCINHSIGGLSRILDSGSMDMFRESRAAARITSVHEQSKQSCQEKSHASESMQIIFNNRKGD